MATNFIISAVFTRINTSCFPCDFASDSALRTSLVLPTRLAADIEDDVAGLETVFGSGTVRINAGDDDTLATGTATSSAGASVKPR